MRALLLTLALCLLPWTVKAQTQIITNAEIDTVPIGRDSMGQFPADTSTVTWDYPMPYDYELEPDSAIMFTLGQVKRMIDSALAAQGRWIWLRYACEDTGLIYYNDPPRCSTEVWVKP
jgi:hypothetical protein